MKTSDFYYELPEELIAQTPVEPRDHSRMLVVHRAGGVLEHRHFYDITDYLNPGDVLVVNNTRVIPARLIGERAGGAAEVLLLKQLGPKRWETLVCPGRRLKPGAEVSSSMGEGTTEGDAGKTGLKPIPLEKGWHPLLVETEGFPGLPELFWQREGGRKEAIPVQAFRMAAP